MFSRDQLKRAASLTEEDSSAGVFYRRRGRINARELWEQMNACSCLNLILTLLHLVAGVGNLLGPQSVRPGRQ